jgi:hypothetical protein
VPCRTQADEQTLGGQHGDAGGKSPGGNRAMRPDEGRDRQTRAGGGGGEGKRGVEIHDVGAVKRASLRRCHLRGADLGTGSIT